MKNRRLALIAGSALAALVALVVMTTTPDDTWELVVDVEARSDGEVLATRQARAATCEPDDHGACFIGWDWEGETLPTDTDEWVKPYFLDRGYIVEVAYTPYWCNVDPQFCRSEITCDGETVIVGPSAECLTQLSEVCGLEPDERGFWYAGTVNVTKGQFGFMEPLLLEEPGEWWESCPVPPPTATPAPPAPTYTPEPTNTALPTPLCRATWTPLPTVTDYPTSTPYPEPAPWPTQPPW